MQTAAHRKFFGCVANRGVRASGCCYQLAASRCVCALSLTTPPIPLLTLVPPPYRFPAVALQAGLHPLIQKQRERQAKSSGSFSFCSCFTAPAVDEPDSRKQVDGPGRLTFLADVDCLVAYLPHKGELARRSTLVSLAGGVGASAGRRQLDYTVHASRNFFASGAMAGAAAGGSGHGSAGNTGHGALPLTPPASSGESAQGSDPSGRSIGLDMSRVIAQVSQYARTRTGQPLTPAASLDRGGADAACITLQIDRGAGCGRVGEFPHSPPGLGSLYSRPAFGHASGSGLSREHSGIDSSRGRDPMCDTARTNRGASPVRGSPSGGRSPVGGGSPIWVHSQAPRGSQPGSPRSPSGTIHKATLRGLVDGPDTSGRWSAPSVAGASVGTRNSGGRAGVDGWGEGAVSAAGVAVVGRGGVQSAVLTGVATTGALTAGVASAAGVGPGAVPAPSGAASGDSWASLTQTRDTRVRNSKSYHTIASVDVGPQTVLAALDNERRRRRSGGGGEAGSEIGRAARGGIGALAALAAAAAADHSTEQQGGT